MNPLKTTKRSTGVPKFLRHLYSILTTEDPSIISWSMDGTSIQLFSVKRLESEILPKYFKHNKLSSFQRQLNYFGFRKWTKTQSCVCTFSHAEFNRSSTLESVLIARKKEGQSFDAYMDEACDALVFGQDVAFDVFESTDEECSDIESIQADDWELCMDMIATSELSTVSLDWFKSEPSFEWTMPLLA
jgi:hypothetical protein